jgi:hypothetical protein
MKKPDTIKKRLATLESCLIVWYRPAFLHITEPDEDNDIQLIIASKLFNNKSVELRIQMVMKTIGLYCDDLFEDRLIIIQAYTPDEMDEVLEYVFNNDDNDSETKEK